MPKQPIDPLERVIRPIVEGQIRGFLKEHPPIVAAVDWYKPRTDKAATFINSLSKRIVRDLLCPISRARLEAAIMASVATVTPPDSPVEFGHAGEAGLAGTPTGQPFARSFAGKPSLSVRVCSCVLPDTLSLWSAYV